MASEIRVDKITSLSGVGTITPSPTGIDIAGITTAATLRATTGIVTSLTAVSSAKVGSGVTLSPDGDIFATGVTTSTTFVGALTGNVTGNISGGTVAGSTGTFTGDVDIADTIVHTGDTNTKIRFPSADNISFEVAGTERLRIDDSDGVIAKHTTAANLRIQNSTAAASQVAQLDMAPAGSVSGVQLKCTSEEDFSTGANRTAYFTVHNRKDGTFYERLRIDSSGKIGIGGAPSAWQSATTTKILQIGNASLFNYNDTFFHVGQNYYWNGSDYKYVNDGWATRLLQNAGEFTFLTSDASGSADGNVNFMSKVRIAPGGDVDIEEGDIFFSTSGKGIVLGATSNTDANTLDDYEEGTFTPTYDGTWTNISNSNLRQAKYTKIGNTVHVWMEYFMTGNNGAIAQNSNIRGFPFTGTSNPADLYPPANVALMYGPTGYAMDETAAGRAYITIYDDRLYFSMGSKSGIRHIWVQLTYPTEY